MYIRIIKPLFDFIIAIFSIVILFPIFIFVPIAIKLNSPGPVFFLQSRLGKNGKVFKIFKSRSMRNDIKTYKFAEILTANHPQITYTGKYCRITCIDDIH